MKNRLVVLMGILISLMGVARADDSVADQTKDSAHTAANAVDKGAHKAKRSVKSSARKAKTGVQNSADDNGVRKVGRKAKDAGNDALDKVDDTVHGH
jgi:hypothetical protein